MKIFFAGVGVHKSKIARLHELGVKNYLHSYEDPDAVGVAAQACADSGSGNSLILDSGAYSVWSRGKEIDIKDYIEFAQNLSEKHKNTINQFNIVNLDVIPGVKGEIPTAEDIEAAAKQGWENMLTIEKAGIIPIPVFHQGEDFKWLDLIKKRHFYIGISPNNDATVNQRFAWCSKVFSILKTDHMTHGFGVTAKKLVWSFPWFSVDSVSWVISPEVYGHAQFTRDYPKLGLSRKVRPHRDYVTFENVKHLKKLEQDCTRLWKSRGVVWSDNGN